MSTIHKDTPTTRDPGKNTIYHILASSSIMDAIRNAEYLPFRYGVNTNHRALTVDLNLSILQGKQEIETPTRIRVLYSRVCS